MERTLPPKIEDDLITAALSQNETFGAENRRLTSALADAQATVEALQRERDKLREATKVICGHCCEPMAIPSKAVLQSQLSALQGLVRVYFTEPDPHKWTAAYQTLKRMGRTLDATTPAPIDAAETHDRMFNRTDRHSEAL